ncbi:MAG: DUF2807 domain-containing protein [Chitinophagaceae bacterium]|nr:DUF2807 domain-containing protein [Chitinophagaceae bacterium]
MKHIFLIALIGLSSVLNAQQVFHDKDAEVRQVGDFHAIEVSSAIDLRLSTGSENALAVSAPDAELRAGIRTEVQNGVLKIWFESKKWFKGKAGARVYVAAKNLSRLRASGACDVTVSGELNVKELSIDMSGASDFKGTVKANSINAELSGASDINIKGEVKNINIHCSGASDFKGYDMIADNCKAQASGASGIRLTVNQEISAVASGASDIHYAGDAKMVDVKASGASNISKKSAT